MADYGYVIDSGVIVPDTATLQSDVVAEWKAALGEDLDTNPETPEGAQIVAEILARSKMAGNNAAVANQINPNYAGGVFLKAICALTGYDPLGATYSVVPGVLLSGQPSYPVPAGSQCRTPAGDLFQSVAAVTFDDSGLAAVDFQAVEAGAVPCEANALNTIATPVSGWETVTNPNAAALGSIEPSDADIRRGRNSTLSLQGQGTAAAVQSYVAILSGYRGHQFRENYKTTVQIIDGITLASKSIWVCVQGATDSSIAAALLEAKGGGCDWNGATTVNTTEPASGQVYAVKFDRPTAVPVGYRVTVKSGASTDPTAAVKNAILAYAAGQMSGFDGLTVGVGVSPFEAAGAVMAALPGIYVQKVEVQKIAAPGYQTTEIPIAINETATVTAAHIAVSVVPQ